MKITNQTLMLTLITSHRIKDITFDLVHQAFVSKNKEDDTICVDIDPSVDTENICIHGSKIDYNYQNRQRVMDSFKVIYGDEFDFEDQVKTISDDIDTNIEEYKNQILFECRNIAHLL